MVGSSVLKFEDRQDRSFVLCGGYGRKENMSKSFESVRRRRRCSNAAELKMQAIDITILSIHSICQF
jgi:hypothetical protein